MDRNALVRLVVAARFEHATGEGAAGQLAKMLPTLSPVRRSAKMSLLNAPTEKRTQASFEKLAAEAKKRVRPRAYVEWERYLARYAKPLHDHPITGVERSTSQSEESPQPATQSSTRR